MSAGVRHRSRLAAGLLALFAGFSGAHRRYLGASWWPVYPLVALPAIGLALRSDPWYRHWGFFVAALVVVVAMAEAIAFSLYPDEQWDTRHNPGHEGRAPSGWLHAPAGWPHVFVAIAALLGGAILLISVMALALETWFLPPGP